MSTEEYKDRHYEDTIFMIKDILEELGIETKEYMWEHSKGYYTTMARVNSLNIQGIGKGCSKQQSFASAYGEFMERLQNLAFFRFRYLLPERINEQLGVYYAPDEKLVGSFDDITFQDEVDEVIDIAMKGQIDTLKNLWLGVHTQYEKSKRQFLAVPFHNYRTKELLYFPAKLLNDVYGTNGMCAGNSCEEAIVQGIAEIFERYANRVIYMNKVVPPIIPNEVLDAIPDVSIMLNGLREDYDVEIRDCSLGIGLPVAGVWLFDKHYGKYYIKFGCHPVLKVAVERCITELFQGRGNDDKLTWEQNLEINEIATDNHKLYNAYKTGNSPYPYEVLGDNFSYPYQYSFIEDETTDNKVFLEFFVKIIEKNHKKLIYRDVSFLGVPAYQVIVIGFSELFSLDQKLLEQNNRFEHVKEIMRNISIANEEELGEILWWMENILTYSDPIAIMADLDFSGGSVFNTSCKVFEMFLNMRLKNYKKAYEAVSEYLNKSKLSDDRMLFFQCFKDVIKVREKAIANDKIVGVLKRLYPNDLLVYVQRMVENPQQYLDTFPKLDCPNCECCPVKESCITKNSIQTQVKLIKKYKNFVQSQ